MTKESIPEENKVSRRSFLAAVLAGASMAVFAAAQPSEAEAQERQFTSFHHEARVSRPRSHTRGSRRHRRVARVRKTGSPRPLEAPVQ
jgi:hypothetical protein